MIYGPGVAYADFGPLVVESDIDDSIIATLKDYFPTYLRRLREERGLEIG
jgi:hypothetical protein